MKLQWDFIQLPLMVKTFKELVSIPILLIILQFLLFRIMFNSVDRGTSIVKYQEVIYY